MKTKYFVLSTLLFSTLVSAASLECAIGPGETLWLNEQPGATEMVFRSAGSYSETLGVQSESSKYLRAGCVFTWSAKGVFKQFTADFNYQDRSLEEPCSGSLPAKFQSNLTKTFPDGHIEQCIVSCTQI